MISASRCSPRTSYRVYGLERLLHEEDAVTQAHVLGLSIKTMDYWLTKFVNSGDLQRIMNGKYQKANALIA